MQPLVSLWFGSQDHRFQVSSRLLGVLPSFISIPRNYKSLDIATISQWSSSVSGLSLSCRLNLDSSNPSTSSNTNCVVNGP